MTLLTAESPSDGLRTHEDELFRLIPELALCKGFAQNNEWHVYDVLEHILHVIDGVPAEPALRLCALFHDIGKPESYTEDSDGVGHFRGHWESSCRIFLGFAEKHGLDEALCKTVADLIFYHDVDPSRLDDEGFAKFRKTFDADGIRALYLLKESDLAAQNPLFYEETHAKQVKQKEQLLRETV